MIKDDKYFMSLAIKEAKKAAEIGEAPIGAVIVRNGKVVARAHNVRESKKTALGHAELVCIQKACKKLGGWRLPESTVYVTLEPCPMCAGGIINARINRVVFGSYDKKAGSVVSLVKLFDEPYNHKPEYVGGVLEDECSALLSDFFKSLRDEKKAKKEAGEEKN